MKAPLRPTVNVFDVNETLIELDPKYVDVIVRRWQDWTGKQATRESDGVAFDDQAASDSSVISQ